MESEKQNDTWKNVICSDVKLCATIQSRRDQQPELMQVVSHTRVHRYTFLGRWLIRPDCHTRLLLLLWCVAHSRCVHISPCKKTV